MKSVKVFVLTVFFQKCQTYFLLFDSFDMKCLSKKVGSNIFTGLTDRENSIFQFKMAKNWITIQDIIAIFLYEDGL